MLSATNYFFFDFDSNPLREAVVVNSSTGAIAFARIEKEVIVLLYLIETNFAGIFILRRQRFTFEDIVIEVRACSRHRFGRFFGTVEVLGDEVFYSAEFDRHAGDYIADKLLSW